MGPPSRSFLRLPALRELWVRVALPGGQLLHIEQDGFLRPFDVSTVLWPAGYLLAQWAADAQTCALWQRDPRPILELGAGTGAASLAALSCGARLAVTTDIASASLALAAANSALNDAAERVHVARFDWHSDESLESIVRLGPYQAVIGAALQFEKWLDRLWHVLDRLTDANHDAVIAFAHTSGSLALPPAPFELADRVPGTAYGMHTAWSDTEADFEVVLVRRRGV